MNREDKLAKLKNKDSVKSMQIITTGETFFEIIEATIEQFQRLTKEGVNLNDLDVLLDRLENLNDLKRSVNSLREAIQTMPKMPEEVKIASVNELLDAIKTIKIEAPEIVLPEQKEVTPPPDYTGAVKRMADALAQLAVTIKASAPKPTSQRAADYVPYRRVIRKGNTYEFDDSVQQGTGGSPTTPTRKDSSGNVYVPVANADGSVISGGGGGGGGDASAAKQDIGNASLSSIDGKITAVNTGAVVISSSALPSGAATSAKQDTGNTSLASIDTSTAAINTVAGAKTDAKSTATDTTSVSMMQVLKQISASAQAPPSQAVTNAGTFAVQATEADGANTTLGSKADAKSTATDTTAITIMQVLKQISASVQAPPSQAVTNTGTFAVQATLAAETTKVIGAINNLPATVDTNSGNKSASTLRVVLATDQPALTNKLLVTPDSVALPANQSVNVSQINGVTPLMGAGNTGTGSPRVTIASDQAVIPVSLTPQTSGGWSTFNATSGDGSTALTSTAQQVKGSAGQVGGWYVYNPNSSAVYVSFYNALSANVTVGTTNQQMVIVIPATQGANVEFTNGIAFSTGISIAATTTGGGNTAPSTALEANIFYK